MYVKAKKSAAGIQKQIIVKISEPVQGRPQIILDGGIGVGRVTKPGLSQKIGEAATIPVPPGPMS